MEKLLRRIKLVDTWSTVLNMSKQDFFDNFSCIVDDDDIGVYSNPLESYYINKREYVGYVDADKFKIRRRRYIFDNIMCSTFAEGKIVQEAETLIIETKVKTFNSFIIGQSLILFLSCSVLFFVAFKSKDLILIPFLIFSGPIMMTLRYRSMRQSIARLKSALEKEFYYLSCTNL